MANSTRDFFRIYFTRRACRSPSTAGLRRVVSRRHQTGCVHSTKPRRPTYVQNHRDGRASVRGQGRTERAALGAVETGTVHVDLTVPQGTAPGVGDNVVFAATSVAGPATFKLQCCALFGFLNRKSEPPLIRNCSMPGTTLRPVLSLADERMNRAI